MKTLAHVAGTPMESVGKNTPSFCSQPTCADCGLQGKTTCRQGCGDVLDFMIPATMFLIPFIGGMVVEGYWTALTVWGVLAAPYFVYFQARLVCRRCPHYNSDKMVLTCHAAFGLPKIPKYNPSPTTRGERFFLYAYLIVLFLYPFPFFLLSRQWLLIVVTGWALFSMVWFVQRRLCVQCINLFCPFNRLPADMKAKWNALQTADSQNGSHF
jgi:hypothetical protein